MKSPLQTARQINKIYLEWAETTMATSSNNVEYIAKDVIQHMLKKQEK